MTRPFQEMQPVLAYVAAHLDGDVSLGTLAARAGLSPFHLHRVFSRAAGETPKQLALRLRLGRAAVLLLTTRDSILDVALSCGFQSHEVFTRAFRRRFGMTPGAYRERGFAGGVSPAQANEHAVLVNMIGPCVSLYRMSEKFRIKEDELMYSITRKELSPQPVLVVRRRVARSGIAAAIGEALPHVFLYAQQKGIVLAGHPFTRYLDVGPGLLTLEPGMRVAASGQEPVAIDPAWIQASGEGQVAQETLPGGPAAVAMHTGPYDTLPNAYAAIEQWMEAEGFSAAGAPWESYVTDPGEVPDPNNWKTEVFWPLAPSDRKRG